MMRKAGLLGGEYGSKRGREGRQWDPKFAVGLDLHKKKGGNETYAKNGGKK
jgi:hypothetical protein